MQGHLVPALVLVADSAGAFALHFIQHFARGLHAVAGRESAAVQCRLDRRRLHRLNRDEALFEQRAFELNHVGSGGEKLLRARQEVFDLVSACPIRGGEGARSSRAARCQPTGSKSRSSQRFGPRGSGRQRDVGDRFLSSLIFRDHHDRRVGELDLADAVANRHVGLLFAGPPVQSKDAVPRRNPEIVLADMKPRLRRFEVVGREQPERALGAHWPRATSPTTTPCRCPPGPTTACLRATEAFGRRRAVAIASAGPLSKP